MTNSTQPIVVRTGVGTSCSTVRLQHQTRRHRLENVRGEEAGTETGGKTLRALGISQLKAVRASGDGQRVTWTACFVSAGPTRVCQPQRGRRLPGSVLGAVSPSRPPGRPAISSRAETGLANDSWKKRTAGPSWPCPCSGTFTAAARALRRAGASSPRSGPAFLRGQAAAARAARRHRAPSTQAAAASGWLCPALQLPRYTESC